MAHGHCQGQSNQTHPASHQQCHGHWCGLVLLLRISAFIKSEFMKTASLFLCDVMKPSTLFIPCPLHCALPHGLVALAGIFPGGDHLKTSSTSLPPSPTHNPLSILTLLPRSHNPSCDKPVPVRGLNFDLRKTTQDRKQGSWAQETADVGELNTLSAGLWERNWEMLWAVGVD